jgi:hypothetical protein
MRGTVPLLLILATAACAADPVAPAAELHLAVEAIDGARPPGGAAEVALTLEHRGGRTVALVGCPRPPYARLERLAGDGWEDAGSHGLLCLAIHSTEAIAFAPGSRLEFRVAVAGPGTYRVRVLAGADARHPEAVALSPRFTVP